ncbi:MAG: hypothetical protein EP312_00680 [Gammaproteobacteria bacterium]|nr:MAG: hypothetical protein EP312_00680 [Gammaproteobacteria bacterium]
MPSESPKPFALTEAQIRFFHVFGYLKLPGLFVDEITEIAKRFDALYENNPAEILNWEHATHYGKNRKILCNLPDRDPYLYGLLADPRIQAIGRGLTGGSFNYIPSEGNIFSGDTDWHTDAYNPILKFPEGHVYFKIALYLDPMTTQGGAFRIIPGSHHHGSQYTQMLNKLLVNGARNLATKAEGIPCSIIESRPGDALIFNFRAQHATCGTIGTRRMFYLGIAQKLNDNINYINEIKSGYLKQFGNVYQEPLKHESNALIRECIEELNT